MPYRLDNFISTASVFFPTEKPKKGEQEIQLWPKNSLSGNEIQLSPKVMTTSEKQVEDRCLMTFYKTLALKSWGM